MLHCNMIAKSLESLGAYVDHIRSLRRIAAWSRDLFAHEIETRARWYRRKIVRPGKFVFPRRSFRVPDQRL